VHLVVTSDARKAFDYFRVQPVLTVLLYTSFHHIVICPIDGKSEGFAFFAGLWKESVRIVEVLFEHLAGILHQAPQVHAISYIPFYVCEIP
jgi:hypothetical protein